MSKTPSKKNPYNVFIVEYTSLGKTFRRPSYAKTEDEALEETKKCILWSWRDDFTMKVVEVEQH